MCDLLDPPFHSADRAIDSKRASRGHRIEVERQEPKSKPWPLARMMQGKAGTALPYFYSTLSLQGQLQWAVSVGVTSQRYLLCLQIAAIRLL